jgi:hypothetical protein
MGRNYLLSVINPLPEPKHICFKENGVSKTGRTKRWIVTAKEDHTDMLGEIQWHGPWRCYVFYAFNAIFEQKCLRDISNFIEYQTKIHKALLHAQPTAKEKTL